MEFQPLLPRPDAATALSKILRTCQLRGTQSLLCAIKYHPSDDNYLSYQGDGYSIGIDIALRGRNRSEVDAFARDLYSYVCDCNGKTFLAKDEIVPRDLFKRMYPSSVDFMRIKRTLDPNTL